MEWSYLLIAAAIIILPIVLTKLFSGKSRDTDKVMGAYMPAEKSAPAPGVPETVTRQVKELIAQGNKIEAIKLVREQTGLGLKEAKDLVDRLG